MNYKISDERASDILKKHYSIDAELSSLISYSDINYLVKTKDKKYVLKLNKDSVRFETDVMLYLENKLPKSLVPKIIENNSGEEIGLFEANGESYFVRLISFIEGETLSKVKEPSSSLLESFGQSLAMLDTALLDFKHAEQNRYLVWDAKHSLQEIGKYKGLLSKSKRELLNHHLSLFEVNAVSKLGNLRQSVIHNDANDQNILVSKDRQSVSGIIDFGDSVKTFLISELANACVYLMMDRKNPLELASKLVRAYNDVLALKTTELELLFEMIVLRLCLSVGLSAFSQLSRPENEYLAVSEGPAWDLLEHFKSFSASKRKTIFLEAIL